MTNVIKRFYPTYHEKTRPVNADNVKSDMRTVFDHLYDTQDAFSAMTGGATAIGMVQSGGIVPAMAFPGFGYNPAKPPKILVTGDGTGAGPFTPVFSNGRLVGLKGPAGTGYTHATITIEDQ